jgi:hypothetical protein
MRTEQGRVAGSGWRLPGTGHAPLLLPLLLVTLGAGCRVIQDVAEVPGQTVRAVTPGKKDKRAVDPVDVQQKLLRFSGEFSAQMIAGIDRLRRGTNAIEPAEALKWKIEIVSECCSIASGPNAIANLLDMTVFVTVSRIALEDHWQPKVYGASAQPILDICRTLETNIWGIAGTLVKTEQKEELRQAIVAWREQHPIPEKMMGARALGFATEVGRAKKADPAAPGSVFGLLGLDPLSGLDPATREIALTRMFAERALFVTQWMPNLLRWQIELMSLNAVAMPEVQQLVTNSTQIAASADRFSRLAEKLPEQVRAERQEILKALESQENTLTPLVNEVRQTLAAGSQMSTSLNTTITTFDALMKRFGVGETNSSITAGPPDTNSAPFRIQDYGQTAVQLEGMARQLTELLQTLDQTIGSSNLTRLSTQAAPVIESAQSAGKRVVDYAFWKGILLAGILFAAALIYRLLAARLSPAARDRKVPP